MSAKSLFAALSVCAVAIAVGVCGIIFTLRGCADDIRNAGLEAGKAEVAAGVQQAAHNATVRQFQRNNQAATFWRDNEQAIAREFAAFYIDIDSAQLDPVTACPSPRREAPVWTLDTVLPADLERDLRLRVAQSNDAICAGAGRDSAATCAAWAKARPAALSLRGITFRRLLRYIGECLEVIVLNDNDKSAVALSLDGK